MGAIVDTAASAISSSRLQGLPNEILLNILAPFSTADLLPLALTSRRFHNLIVRIIHTRLLAAAPPAHYQLVLECYRPANKISTPYFLCDYIGTDEVDLDTEDVGNLGRLRNMFSHFRPNQPEGSRKVWRPHPAGGWLPATLDEFRTNELDLVEQDVDLESHELFTQLQSQVNLVKVGPNRGLFLSVTEVEEGLTRIWRDWLADRAKNLIPLSSDIEEPVEEHQERLLWSTTHKHTGLRVRVLQQDDTPAPILIATHEDPNISYTLQYEELIVRTSHMLLKYEQARDTEVTHSGNALVLVSS